MDEKKFTGTLVQVHDNNIDAALRKLKRILKKDNWSQDISKKRYFKKASDRKRQGSRS